MIEDIKSFMKDIEMLNKKLDAQDKIINEQVLEIARLKEQLEYLRSNEYLNQVKWERNFNEELVKDLQQKIDKAIEYIKEELYEVGGCIHGSDLPHSAIEPILEILGDKKMIKECENCIKRKTMWCPTSMDCMALDELPYYLDKISALEKIDKLKQENKQLKEQKKQAIEYINSSDFVYDELYKKREKIEKILGDKENE